jgi:hypothetical protein
MKSVTHLLDEYISLTYPSSGRKIRRDGGDFEFTFSSKGDRHERSSHTRNLIPHIHKIIH